MGIPEKILWGRLTPGERKLYVRYEQAFAVCAPAVDGAGLERDVDELKVMLAVLGDHPEVIYCNRTQLRLSRPVFGNKVIRLEGAMSAAQNRTRAQALQAAVEQAEAEIALLNPISDYDKLICIYEYIQDHVTYDGQEGEYNAWHNATRAPTRHNAYGALVEGLAVCDGFACAFALLAQRLGFRCTTVTGEGIAPSGGRFPHAWNIVAAGDAYYHLDVTWDKNRESKGGDYSYEYFCLDDSEAGLEHIWAAETTPACGSQALSFYFRNRCQANSLSQLDDIFLRYVKTKASVVRVKLNGGVAVPEPGNIAQRLLDAAASVGRSIRIEYQWNSALQCFYAKIL